MSCNVTDFFTHVTEGYYYLQSIFKIRLFCEKFTKQIFYIENLSSIHTHTHTHTFNNSHNNFTFRMFALCLWVLALA